MRAEVNDDSGLSAPLGLGSDSIAKLVTDRLPVRIAYVDRTYTYRFINAEYELYFNLPPGGAVGRTVAEVAGEAAFAVAKPQLDKTFLGQDVVQEVEVDFGRGPRRVVVTARPDIADDGAVRGAIVHSVDITESYLANRKREERDRFLLSLEDALRPLTDAAAIMLTAATFLGRCLGVDRCAYADIEADQDTMNLAGNHLRSPEIKSIVGRMRFYDFGEEVLQLMRDNKPYVVNDVDTHQPPVGDPVAYRATQIQAVICVPLHKEGRFVAAMAVHCATPRVWKPEEVELTLTVASRCWESIERARVSRELAESEERRRLALESGEIGSWNIDVQGAILRSDGKFREIFCGSSQDLTYEQAFACIHPDDRERIREAVAASCDPSNPVPYAEEYRVVHGDGQIRWVSAKGRLNYSAVVPTRELGSLDGTVLDVTERVRAEEELRKSEERYRTLFGSIDEGFCVLEVIFDEHQKPVDYRFIEVNPTFERFTGIDADAALGGKTVKEIIPNLEDKWIELYGRVALTGESIRLEEGSEAMGRWFDVNASRVGEPEARRVAVIFNETTARKAIEVERERLLRDLQVERQRLGEVFEQAPAFLALLTGPDFTFEYANQAYIQLVNRPVVGMKLEEALPEINSQGFTELLQGVLSKGEPYVGQGASVFLTSENDLTPKEHILDFVYQPVSDAGGTVYGVLVHGVDVTDQHRARQQIAASEERFRAVFEQAPDDAILLTDFDRRIQAWNAAAERITGWTAAEALGQSADIIFTPEDRTAGQPDDESRKAVQDGKAIDERWHVRKDGSRFWGSGTMNALHDSSGQVLGFLKIFRDATERYDQVRTLSFLRELTDAVAGIDDADAIISAMEHMLGEFLQVERIAFGEFEPDEDHFSVRFDWVKGLASVAGTHRLSDYGEQIHNNLLQGNMEVLRDRRSEIEETDEEKEALIPEVQSAITVPVKKDNKLIAIFVIHHTQPRYWREAELTIVQQVADRLTSEIERARAETALRTSEERLRQLVELSPSTVWFGEPTGELSYISQDFYDTTGLSPVDSLPNGWLQAVHPDDVPKVRHDWEKALHKEAPYDTEMRIRHRDGQYRWISARALPIRDNDGKVAGWLGSNSDIQDQKEIEETLRARVEERTQELQQAVREAEGFNYSISHDLRAPVRAIVSTASILLDEASAKLAEQHRELLKRQVHNANRLGVLIDELLRLSRLARVEVKRVPLDMTTKARAIAADMQTGCRIEVQEGMKGEGDPGLVRTIYQNLIENACKFSGEDALIEVGQKDDIFWVKDYGVGFDMKYMSKIFQPFERLVSESEFPGTGIGLANVERIVKRHGGRVWAESEPGKGATFFFTLS